MHWSESLHLSTDPVKPVVITAAGTFDATSMSHVPDWAKGPTDKTITIPEWALDDMVANFETNALGTLPFIDDGGHREEKASAVFSKLWKAPFTDDKGREHLGLYGQPDWTDDGAASISQGVWGYLSGLFGPISDGETGEILTHEDGRPSIALRSATPTNKPVLTILPRLMLEKGVALEQSTPLDLVRFSEVDFVELATKAVGGEAHPASDFAYVPDPTKPSTWKFPIFDKSHVANAAARANQSDIPEEDIGAVKKKIRAAHRRLLPDVPVPDSLKAEGGPMPDDAQLEKDVEAQRVALAKLNDDFTTTQAALAATNQVLATQREEVRSVTLEADAAKIANISWDKPTQARLMELATVTYGSTLPTRKTEEGFVALEEGQSGSRPIDVMLSILDTAVPVKHTQAEGFIPFTPIKGDGVSLEQQKETARQMYKNDPDKLAKVLARLDTEGA